mgnify:CR=1 FL=1
MAIVLEVQPYCANCLDFDSEITKPTRIEHLDGEYIYGDTVVRCRYAKRCENIRKYLTRQKKIVDAIDALNN